MATKQEFVNSSFIYNAVNAAVQRNSLYGNTSRNVRSCIRRELRVGVEQLLAPFLTSSKVNPTGQPRYCNGWSADEGAFLTAVDGLRTRVNQAFCVNNASRNCRVSHAQKALAVALKYFWCAGLTKNPPPFCPIDRRILEAVGIRNSWTKLDDMDTYISWLMALTYRAKQDGYCSLADWELAKWS